MSSVDKVLTKLPRNYVYKGVEQGVALSRTFSIVKVSQCAAWHPDNPYWDDYHHYYQYSDVMMSTIASLITSLAVVYSTFYSDADQRKHQSSASLAFVWGIHRDRWIPRTKGQLRGKCFHLMTSSCYGLKVVFVCVISVVIPIIKIRLSHYHHQANFSEGIEYI